MVSGEMLLPQFHFHVGALSVSFLEGLIFDLYYYYRTGRFVPILLPSPLLLVYGVRGTTTINATLLP